jgi:hypothetical protein
MSINYKDNFSNYNENFENASSVPNATSCHGWACNIEGQVCPLGTPGASDGTYVCQNGSWTKSSSQIPNATSCHGWACSIENQVCPLGTPGASDGTYVCQNGSWTKSNNAVNSTAEASSVTKSENPVPVIKTETVTHTSSTTGETRQPLTIEQQLQEIKTQNNALKMSKETLEESMKKQARALFLAKNFYRIDDSSFNNEVTFINDNFVDVRLPQSEFNGKRIVSTQQEWNDLLTKASGYKNLYKPGDVVIKPADYNISKDTVCYKDYETHLSNDPNFKKKYPECMVCSVNPDSDYKNTKSWKNTKTNIHKVCLFNPNAPDNSTILNYNGCKNLCSLD